MCYAFRLAAAPGSLIPGRTANRPSPGTGQFIKLALGPIPLVAVPSLQSPNDLIPPSGGLIQIVIGQIAPFLLDLPLKLLPIALDLIPVHSLPPDLMTSMAPVVNLDEAPSVCRPGAR